MKIAIVGDIHGHMDALNSIVALEREKGEEPQAIIQCGDFGVWNHNWNGGVKVDFDHIPVYFCRGNHEEHNALDTLPQDKIESLAMLHPENSKNIFHCPFGSVLTIEGWNFLFVGGADSIDKAFREENITWWKQETISEAQMEAFRAKELPKIDFVISHTCPSMVLEDERFQKLFDGEYLTAKNADPSCDYLQEVYERVKPSGAWFFGHWHKLYTNQIDNTPFFCIPNHDQLHARFIPKYDDYYITING